MGARIREARIAAGLSQSEAARRVGVSRSAIRLWESGKGGITEDNLQRLAQTLRCDEKWITGPKIPDREREILMAIAKMLQQVRDVPPENSEARAIVSRVELDHIHGLLDVLHHRLTRIEAVLDVDFVSVVRPESEESLRAEWVETWQQAEADLVRRSEAADDPAPARAPRRRRR